MKLSLSLLGLVVSSSAVSQSATPTSTPTIAPSASNDPDDAAAADNSAIDAFVQCLWPVTDRFVNEIAALSDVSFNKFIDEIHWEILWWGNPSKWVPDIAGLGLNATMMASCLLEVVGEGLAYSTVDLTNEFLKTFHLIHKNATNTAVPGLK